MTSNGPLADDRQTNEPFGPEGPKNSKDANNTMVSVSESRSVFNSAAEPRDAVNDSSNISNIDAETKLANENVSPFLVKHIPTQYAPMGGQEKNSNPSNPTNPNSKYCYRHRPDLNCRRQPDEPSMEQLQRVCSLTSFWLECVLI